MFVLHPKNVAFAHHKTNRVPNLGYSANGGAFIGVWILSWVLVISFLFGVPTLAQWNQNQQLKTQGVETTGTITILTSPDSNFVYYDFQDIRAEDSAKGRVQGAAIHSRYEEGDTVTVRYLPDNSTVSTIDDYYPLSIWRVVVTFGMLALIPWSIALIIKDLLKTKEFRAHGTRVTGKVLSAHVREDSDGDSVLEIQYRFTSPKSGKQITDKTETYQKQHFAAPPLHGTLVAIFYLDDKTFTLL